jgi:hypothetical protein
VRYLNAANVTVRPKLPEDRLWALRQAGECAGLTYVQVLAAIDGQVAHVCLLAAAAQLMEMQAWTPEQWRAAGGLDATL